MEVAGFEFEDKWLLWGLLAVSLAVRLPFVFQESLWNDETVYMWFSRHLSQDPSFITRQKVGSFGYVPVVAGALVNLVLGDAFVSMRLVNLLMAVAGIGLVYDMGRELLGEWGGFFAGAILSVNHLYYFLSTRALLDVPLTFAFTLALWAVFRYDGSWRSDLVLLGATAIALFTKSAGVLVAAPVGTFMLAKFFQDESFAKEKLLPWALALLVLGAAYFGVSRALYGSATPTTFSQVQKDQDPFFYVNNAQLIYLWPVFLGALAGVAFLDSPRKYALMAAFGGVLLVFSRFAGWNFPRYVLPSVPPAILLCLLSVKEVSSRVELDWRLPAGVLVAYALFMSPGALQMTRQRSLTYTGFRELGQGVAELDDAYNFSTIYAQSHRQVRFFSGREYESDGGKVSRLPAEIGDFRNESRVLLQLDVWEYAGPDWSHPLSQELMDQLAALNFTPVQVVERPYPTGQGVQNVPVAFLMFKR